MVYIDGFVVPVPTARLAEYRKLARKASKVWLAHGALSYMEAVAEDVKPGKLTSFPQSVDLKTGETVIFSYITYKSRAHRDKVAAKAMKDPAFAGMDPKTLPFDAQRMIHGGFRELVSATLPHS